MSTLVPGFQSFFNFFASFCIGQIATSIIGVNPSNAEATYVQRNKDYGYRFMKTILTL